MQEEFCNHDDPISFQLLDIVRFRLTALSAARKGSIRVMNGVTVSF